MASHIQRAAKEFLLAAKKRPDGFFQEDVDKQFPDNNLLKSVLNMLLKKARIHMREDVQNGRPVFYYVEQKIAKKFTSHTREEIEMYHMIAQCGDRGILRETLKIQGNFPGNTMDEMFARLQKSELVNQLNTDHKLTKEQKVVFLRRAKHFKIGGDMELMILSFLQDVKVYIRSVVPSPSIAVEYCYNGGQFDKAFADVVSDYCLEFSEDKNDVTLAEVHEFVNQKLSEQDKNVSLRGVNQVMGCLVVDGVLDPVGNKLKINPSIVAQALQPGSSSVLGKRGRNVSMNLVSGATKYKKNPYSFEDKESIAFQIPCCACPIATQCHSGGIISPEKCEYMKAWLECEKEPDTEQKDGIKDTAMSVDDLEW